MTAETPTETVSDPKARRYALLMVFLVVFIDLLGFGLVLPVLPRYGKEFVQPVLEPSLPALEYPWAVGTVIGLLYASFSIMQFTFAPIWGRVSDRIGRRPVLLLGLIGSVVFYALFGVGASVEGAPALALTLLFIARIGAGVAGATISTAQAAIADVTSAKDRSRGMALIGAAFGLGFSFGPALGAGAAWLAPQSPGLPAFLAAGLSGVALLIGVTKLPETRQTGRSGPPRGWISLRHWSDTLRTRGVGGLVLIFFLATLAFASLETTLANLTERFGFQIRDNFLIFSAVGFTLMVAQGAVYRPLARRVSETTFMMLGVVLLTAGLTVLALLAGSAKPENWSGATLAGMLTAMTLSVFGFAFLTPSAQSLISRRTSADRQGEVLGVNQSASALARILGPISGLTLFFTRADLPYWVSVGLLAVVFVLIPATPSVPDAVDTEEKR